MKSHRLESVAFAVKTAQMDATKSEYLTHIHVANADGTEACLVNNSAPSAAIPGCAGIKMSKVTT